MGLIKQKLGKYIERIERRNYDLEYGIDSVRGISNTKEIQQTKADISDRSFTRFQIVKPNEFVFNRRTTRMGEKIGLGYNNIGENFIVTEDYVVFRVADETVLLPDYLNIFFRRSEFDRYVRWDSWGSATEFFNWEEMCDVSIKLPPVQIQQKYVDIYNAMLDNQKVYERGLEDLKLVCDSYIEELRKNTSCEPIGKYLRECDEKNTDLSVTLAQGIDVNMQFIPAKREASDKEGTRIVRNGQFAFNKVVKSNGTKLPIALRRGPDCFISGSYQVFEVMDTEHLLPEYLMLWMARTETQRFCGFNAWGSTRDVFPFEELCKLEFPIPDIEIQQDIVNIYHAYILRKDINEKLKAQIKELCPILIKGSLEEANV
jgi:type I restriction enzyme S subunit